MFHFGCFGKKAPWGDFLMTFAAVAVASAVALVGSRGLAAAAAADEGRPGAQPGQPPGSGEGPKVSAAALMKAAYDGQAWLDSARTFRIRTAYKITHTEAGRRWDEAHPRAYAAAGSKLDRRPFCVRSEWAWDAKRIRFHGESYYEGQTGFNQQTRIWDGSLAVEIGESADHADKHYVLDNKLGTMFGQSSLMLEIPWWPGGVQRFWWRPVDVAAARSSQYVAPKDFELEGEQIINGRRCHVLLTRAGHYRMHVGVMDGRLYRRTYLSPGPRAGHDYLALCQKIGGPSIKSPADWPRWLGGLKPPERARAEREFQVALFASARPRFYQTWDDYREVAPGCWLPFRQTVDNYNLEAPESFLNFHNEQTVAEAMANQPLADDLFRIELTEGVPVVTDWRYDPPIRYNYRRNQTEADRAAICEAERLERAKQEFDRKR